MTSDLPCALCPEPYALSSVLCALSPVPCALCPEPTYLYFELFTFYFLLPFLLLPYLCTMESKRQQKISRLLQKDLGEIFRLMAQDHLRGYLITVTKVNITPDMSIARVFLSLFGPGEKSEIFKSINKHKKDIRHQLAIRVKGQLRIIPDLEFVVDDSLDYIENIERLLNN